MNGLVPVTWDGVNLNEGERPDGLLTVVTDVQGWYGTPPMAGNDLDLVLTDGALFGVKVISRRTIVVTGSVTGPRDGCLVMARQLAGIAGGRVPVTLVIGEDGHALSAYVRADDEAMSHAWHGPVWFEWEVTLTAGDPRLYEEGWHTQLLTLGGTAESGRTYPRSYAWQYGAPVLGNSARLENPGTAEAPAWAIYTGPLTETRLTDGTNTIRLAPLGVGQQVTVATESLMAVAPGGATRASYILGGSAPLTVPPGSVGMWSLYGSGTGTVELQWRAAWI